MVTHVALFLLEALGFGELLGIELALEFALELAEELALADDQARFEQARLDGHILRRELNAFGDRSHAVSDIEADVPQQADELLELLGQRGIGRLRQQDQQIDIGIGEKLAAAIAANCDERGIGRHCNVLPTGFERVVDELAMLAQQRRRRRMVEITLAQRRAAVRQPPFQPRARRFHRSGRRGRQLRRVRH